MKDEGELKILGRMSNRDDVGEEVTIEMGEEIHGARDEVRCEM